MLHSRHQWVLRAPVEHEKIVQLSGATQTSIRAARVLAQRGLVGQGVRRFLQPTLRDLHDPFLMKDMEVAVQRLQLAKERGEKVLVYGDYDVDGVASVAILVLACRRQGLEVDTYIPHRTKEGYGLHIKPLRQAAQRGISLVITVDTGIANHAVAAEAAAMGLDLIITDHHCCTAIVPIAHAVLNPKRPDCAYPFKELCGAGIAFKLVTAWLGHLPTDLLDLVALATVADVVPLQDENRVLVAHGLGCFRQRPGLAALLRVAKLAADHPVTAEHVGFSLGPRLNAAGRLDHAQPALDLLLAEEDRQAKALAKELDRWNQQRQWAVDGMVKEAVREIEQNRSLYQYGIVLENPAFHIGVVGIVASQLVEKYGCPAIVLTVDPQTGEAKGSARSIQGFNLYAELKKADELLSRWGGHAQAAGMTLPMRRIPELRQSLQCSFLEVLPTLPKKPEILVDAVVELRELDEVFWQDLQFLGPCGQGNPPPRIVVQGARIVDCQVLGDHGQHARMVFQQRDVIKQAIAFRCSDWLDQAQRAPEVDLLAQWVVNLWRGKRTYQLQLEDIRHSRVGQV
ncbi:single-stranded-DNA-specific exonuclease RecJ [Pasteuria penetrans]|uniref:single-stranded-DNA-specific exonuclease RecJ n=1 Tax=Pasteuria penetrans TaxID=86005 RepID=UPI000F943A9C|nr:single-stranded-DNA-specific exonuclease RecJ [Pasteuria penetrans]